MWRLMVKPVYLQYILSWFNQKYIILLMLNNFIEAKIIERNW